MERINEGKITIEQSCAPVSERMIREVMEVEAAVYAPQDRGMYESIARRVEKKPDMLILAKDGKKIVGYLCYFPIKESLYRDIIENGEYHDDDIQPEDILPFYNGAHLFLISIAILPAYQNIGLADKLMKFMDDCIKYQGIQGNRTEDILAAVVTPDGEKLAQRFGFTLRHNHMDDYKIYWRKGYQHEG